MLDLASKNTKRVIVLDILPIREELYPSLGWFDIPIYTNNKDVETYNAELKEICKEKNIEFFTRYQNWKTRNLADLYKDTGHPTAQGHQIIADEVYNYLFKTL